MVHPKRSWIRILGPGLISGLSDDDPSGVATYSQVGAQFGLTMLWLMPYTIPLIAAIQEICARIGRVTGRGIARNMRLHYPSAIVCPIILILAAANVMNLAADLGAMGDCLRLLIGGSSLVFTVCFGVGSVALQIALSYQRYTTILKWGGIILGVYILTALAIRPGWRIVFHASVVPHGSFDPPFIAAIVAVLGTTISPYLFFWQASLEAEETAITPGDAPLLKVPQQARDQFFRIRLDTWAGMVVSNLIGFFIILDTGVILHTKTVTHIDSAQQAAQALAPLAGSAATLLFCIGIIGGGLLAIPVLAGSIAYAIGELFRWPVGMNRKPHKAKGFYTILSLATALGVGLNVLQINPIKALYWSAVINGLAAVPIMVLIMLMFHSSKVMGKFARKSRTLKFFGWTATAAMTVASIGLFITWGK
jgi:Mn2+/Fe2+ NRAMP family transporter